MNSNQKTFSIVSDLHGQFESITIRKCDYLLICGDMINRSAKDKKYDVKKTMTEFVEWLKNVKAEHILIVFGNHERGIQKIFSRLLRSLSNVHVLENNMVVIDGIQFYGFSYKIGEKQIEKANNTIKTEKKCVLLAHQPPKNIMDYRFDNEKQGMGNLGSDELLKFCDERKPEMCCGGHCHESRGIKKIENTLYINAANTDAEGTVTDDRNKPFEVIYRDGIFVQESWIENNCNEEENNNYKEEIDNNCYPKENIKESDNNWNEEKTFSLSEEQTKKQPNVVNMVKCH